MDILSYSGLHDQSGVDHLETSWTETEERDWCLFSIEVRNTYGLPFEVVFERINGGEGTAVSPDPVRPESPPDIVAASTCRVVPPGSTCRCVIDLPILGNSELRVASKDNFTATEVTLDRRTNI